MNMSILKWELIGIHNDPEIAVLIANTWQEVVLDRLDEAMEHAWKAQTLQGVSFNVVCVAMLVTEKLEDTLSCVTLGPEVDPEVLVQLREEIISSHGILPVINYEFLQNASAPESPVLWSRGVLVFSGGMIGFLLGLIRLSLPEKCIKIKIQN